MKNFIQKIHLKKEALHRQLHVPLSQKIPKAVLYRASKAKGKLGQRARFALTLERLHK